LSALAATLAFLLFELVLLVPLRTFLIGVFGSLDADSIAIALSIWATEAIAFGVATVVIMLVFKVVLKKCREQKASLPKEDKLSYLPEIGVASAVAYFFYWAVFFNYFGGIFRMSFFNATLLFGDASTPVYFAGVFVAPFLKAVFVGGATVVLATVLIAVSKRLKKTETVVKQDRSCQAGFAQLREND